MSRRVYDVALLSDFRYPGGTSASVAEEVRAQASAGLSTVLVHVRAQHLRTFFSFNRRLVDCLRDDAADLALPGDAVSARLLVIRQPRIFATDPRPVPRVWADRAVMVVNQGPRDAGDRPPYYDLGDVRRRVEHYFGEAVRWSPIGPLVRAQVLAEDPSFPVTPSDWHNIIDVDQWWVDRRAPVGAVPVIGRHGRADPKKWPTTSKEIMQAYPTSKAFRVRFLGGGEIAVERLGRRPDSWDILPFGSMHPREFLRGIDYFVYFHDPDWIEAFGRTILEAMASGAPVILPESFRALFKDAALYAVPEQVVDIVESLHADWDRYREVSRRARDFADERFGYRSHVARLEELGVTVEGRVTASTRTMAPAQSTTVQGTPTGATRRPSSRLTRVMMVSSNGAGLGHVTRLMAIARRLPDDMAAVIATQSLAAPLVQQAGYLTEYIPSRLYLGIHSKRWNRLLYQRLLHLIAVHAPSIVAVDGTCPYAGLLRAMADHPDITWVWVRRAMWRQGLGQRWIERGTAFDFVLEPGEFAASVDEGPTVADRDRARCVGPMTYLDASELVDRESARRELELDDKPAALLQLGAGNINDVRSPSARIAAHLDDHGFQVVLAQSPIATQDLPAPRGGRVVSVYPLSRYLRAFDLVVSAGGYNSFHELIGFSVPTVFVPNAETALDDQVARVRYASSVGAALAIDDPSGGQVEEVLARAAKPEVRADLAQRCAELAIPNGSAYAADWIASLSSDRAHPKRGHERSVTDGSAGAASHRL